MRGLLGGDYDRKGIVVPYWKAEKGPVDVSLDLAKYCHVRFSVQRGMSKHFSLMRASLYSANHPSSVIRLISLTNIIIDSIVYYEFLSSVSVVTFQISSPSSCEAIIPAHINTGSSFQGFTHPYRALPTNKGLHSFKSVSIVGLIIVQIGTRLWQGSQPLDTQSSERTRIALIDSILTSSMWLLHTDTLALKEFIGSNLPIYAILSHTWMDEEISFAEMQNPDETIRNKAGFKKVEKFCTVARDRGFAYGWADTCCIDKRSSAELTEAINSMYRYYYNAAMCVVYLEDVLVNDETEHQSTLLGAIESSRWFTRCWTLQELLASRTRYFFAGDWSLIKNSVDTKSVIVKATGINQQVLENRNMISTCPIAQRMRWASHRNATRQEDIAYSLMGLFNVQMPILYGEGSKKAFRRLQTEIMQTSFDQTIFAWCSDSASSGLLANSPADFRNTLEVAPWGPSKTLAPFHMTNVGLSIRLVILDEAAKCSSFFSRSEAGAIPYSLAALRCDCKHGSLWKVLLIHLEPVEDTTVFVNGESCKGYRRIRCDKIIPAKGEALEGWPTENIIVLEDEQYQLLMRAKEENQKRLSFQGA